MSSAIGDAVVPGPGAGAIPEAEVVTGERLQSLAEVVLLPKMIARRGRGPRGAASEVIEFETHRELDEARIRRLSAAGSIFVYTDALKLFQEHVWPRLTGSGHVLITHNSDYEIGGAELPWVENAGEKLRHWFAQNLLVSHPKLSPLPSGLANSTRPHGDLALLARISAQAAPKSGLLHACFDRSTHPDRHRAWSAIRQAFPQLPEPPASRRPFGEYLRDLSSHRFSACPRGNGIDTHRFWECQYLGVIPVVERSAHVERWAREGCRMVILDEWSDLSRERLESEPAWPSARADCLRLSHHAKRLCMFRRASQ
jgi:hypothetical protein